MRKRNPLDERQVRVSLTEQGRAFRAETRTLANALYDRSGMSVEALAGLNARIKALRDAFRTS